MGILRIHACTGELRRRVKEGAFMCEIAIEFNSEGHEADSDPFLSEDPNERTSLHFLQKLREQQPHNPSAWAQFITIYWPALVYAGRRKGLGQEDAEDAAQSTFMVVAERYWKEYDIRRGRLRHWVRGIHKHKVQEKRRKIAMRFLREGRAVESPSHLDESDTANSDDFEENEWRKSLICGYLNLANKHHLIKPFTMKIFELLLTGMSKEAVAARLGITVNNVSKAKTRVVGCLHNMHREVTMAWEVPSPGPTANAQSHQAHPARPTRNSPDARRTATLDGALQHG